MELSAGEIQSIGLVLRVSKTSVGADPTGPVFAESKWCFVYETVIWLGSLDVNSSFGGWFLREN